MVINLIVGCLLTDKGNYVISRDGKLPLESKADLRFFSKLTKGSPVVMGKNTWNSLPNRPLKDRVNFILANGLSTGILNEKEMVNVDIRHLYSVGEDKDSIEKCIKRIKDNDNLTDDATIWIIGGSKVYKNFAPFVDNIIMTVNKVPVNSWLYSHDDVLFPIEAFSKLVEVKKIDLPGDTTNSLQVIHYIPLSKIKHNDLI